MTTTPRTGKTTIINLGVSGDEYRQLEKELADTQAQLAEANRLTLRAEASVENYASAAEELRRELNELRAELARIQGKTRWQCTCGGTDCEGQRENEEQARLLDMSATREARLRADLVNCQRDLHELLRLLGEIRMATGDRGKRNQADLVAYCADLAKRAAVLEKVRAYPYIPQGLAALIERELAPDNPAADLDRIFSPSA